MATEKVSTDFADDEYQQLLPGIPDDITLNEICTKLPWSAVYVLSLVSPAWQRATRSRQVNEARKRSRSTETLVVLGRAVNTKSFAFDLYSLKDKARYPLPWLSQVEGICGWNNKCASLNGKIYAIGRKKDLSKPGAEVCVLDMVANCQGWTNCADKKAQRLNFKCGVTNGTIFAIAGADVEDREAESEVYDPVTDVWSSIPSMTSPRIDYGVVTLGEELYVCGGEPRDWGDNSRITCPSEIYNPSKNEWRQVEPSWPKSDLLFMSHGKLYRVGEDAGRWHPGIYVRTDGVHNDSSGKTAWKLVQLLLDGDSRLRLPSKLPYHVVAVGDEVLDMLYIPGAPSDGSFLCFRQSKGFGSAAEEFVWETVNICVNKYGPDSQTQIMCTVEL